MKAGLTRGMGLAVGGGGVKRSSSNPLLSDWPISPGLDRKEVSSLSSLFPIYLWFYIYLYPFLPFVLLEGCLCADYAVMILFVCLNRLIVEYE